MIDSSLSARWVHRVPVVIIMYARLMYKVFSMQRFDKRRFGLQEFGSVGLYFIFNLKGGCTQNILSTQNLLFHSYIYVLCIITNVHIYMGNCNKI